MTIHEGSGANEAEVKHPIMLLPDDILNVTPETYEALLDQYAMNVSRARDALGDAAEASAARPDPATAYPIVAEATAGYNYTTMHELLQLLWAYEPEIFGLDPSLEAEPQA